MAATELKPDFKLMRISKKTDRNNGTALYSALPLRLHINATSE